MPIKKTKQSSVRCRECDATSQDAFLEKIKGTNEYICDDCASDGNAAAYEEIEDYGEDDNESLESHEGEEDFYEDELY